MERIYSGETLIDSSVFLSILKQESLIGKCSDFLDSLERRNRRVVVTPNIIKEVVREMEEFIRENNRNSSTLRLNDEKNFVGDWNSFLTNFNNLLKDAKVFFPYKGFGAILKDCYRSLHCGESDKINIALCISNNCRELVTCDRKLFLDKPTMERISGYILDVELIE